MTRSFGGGRLVGFLLAGLFVALVVASLTKNNRPIFFGLIVIGSSLTIGIGREWLAVNRIRRASGGALIRRYLLFVIGSVPYVTAISLLLVFSYCSLLLLFDRPIDMSQSTGLVRVVLFSFIAVFLGGFLSFSMIVKKANRPNQGRNEE